MTSPARDCDGLELGLAGCELRLLLLDRQRGVVVGAEVGVDDGLVGHDDVGRALGDDACPGP